jgi:hypothetical protein
MCNCSLLCRTHHNHKTHDGHSYQRVDPDTGEILWTTPLGFTYRQTPPTYTPDGPDPGNTTRETASLDPDDDEPPF